ncbi:MAG: TIGR00282 family metallophosphoesterase [Deltaproteobacteria bacterium]|nr:MAG: TIGR00282 family metallophosphoesterase [Deltaproteobacteria bacterium]
MKILFIGDIIGRPGRQMVDRHLGSLVDRHMIDLVVANAENAAAGFGVTPDVVAELFDAGVDVLTTGNHVWDKKEALPILEQERRLLRPANYPPGLPGRGWGVFRTSADVPVAVVNLEGRVFMNNLDCPFRAADAILEALPGRPPVVLVDFHAETTSEKNALGAYLDGRVSAVLGTHTHVQTADERLMPGGTAFISDAGMTGSRDSVIGIRKELSVERFLTQLPVRFEVAKREPMLCGVVVTVDETTGRAQGIERVQIVDVE